MDWAFLIGDVEPGASGARLLGDSPPTLLSDVTFRICLLSGGDSATRGPPIAATVARRWGAPGGTGARRL